jgi:hypothetical protein
MIDDSNSKRQLALYQPKENNEYIIVPVITIVSFIVLLFAMWLLSIIVT